MSDPAQNPTPTEPTTPVSPTPTPEPPIEPTSLLDGASAPEPFDVEKLTLPEGFDRESEPFKEFTTLAKEAGFSGDAAQKLVDFHLKYTKAAGDALMNDWASLQEKWVGEVKADKEIGNIETMRQTISKVADNPEFTDPGFKEALALTGAGNNPAVLRTLFRWAKALGEGGPVQGSPAVRNAQGALVNQPPTFADAIYGPSGPHTGGPRLS